MQQIALIITTNVKSEAVQSSLVDEIHLALQSFHLCWWNPKPNHKTWFYNCYIWQGL